LGSKDGTNGNNKKFTENSSKNDAGIRMLKDPMKSGLNVVNILKNILLRQCQPQMPYPS
jgi:hypothetical protein